jgi:pyruvate kinase
MNWGVVPILYQTPSTDEEKIAYCIELSLEGRILKKGDVVIATNGSSQATGGTNLIRVLSVESRAVE